MKKSLRWHLFIRIFVATTLIFVANRLIAQYLTGQHMNARIEQIPGRLDSIWAESQASGRNPAAVADAMAQKLIGRG